MPKVITAEFFRHGLGDKIRVNAIAAGTIGAGGIILLIRNIDF